jgi:hypothetical protein
MSRALTLFTMLRRAELRSTPRPVIDAAVSLR